MTLISQKQARVVVLQDLGIGRERQMQLFAARLPMCEVRHYDRGTFGKGDLSDVLRRAEIAVTVNQPIDAEAIRAARELKMIAIAFTGTDHIDIASANERRIVVANVPDYCTNSVAELAIGTVITLMRDVYEQSSGMRSGIWRAYNPGNELYGKTVGIVGLGKIGTRVAELFRAFGCEVIAWNRTEKEVPGVRLVSNLGELAESSDIVTIHLALTPETRNLIDGVFLAHMKSTAFLINTARGPVVDNQGLVDAIMARRIAGAVIDVYDREPLEIGEARKLPKNMLAIPHIGFFTVEALQRRAEQTVHNIVNFLEGR